MFAFSPYCFRRISPIGTIVIDAVVIYLLYHFKFSRTQI